MAKMLQHRTNPADAGFFINDVVTMWTQLEINPFIS